MNAVELNKYCRTLAPFNRDRMVHVWKLLRKYPHITELNLINCGIDDRLVRVLAHNTTLLSVNLSYNKLTNIGAFYLCRNETLRFINVSHNQIGFLGISSLRDHKKEGVIMVINVKDNPGYEKWKVLKSQL